MSCVPWGLHTVFNKPFHLGKLVQTYGQKQMVSARWYQLSTPVHLSALIMGYYIYIFMSANETISQLEEYIPR